METELAVKKDKTNHVKLKGQRFQRECGSGLVSRVW